MEIKQATVLLVEDEPFLREIMGAWLERVAGRVFCAGDGRAAMKILEANNVDLVISDVRMPVMDGVELLKWIKARPAPRPCMIFVTGFSDLTLREAFDMGAETILEKPIRREELLQIAKNSLAPLEDLWQRAAAAAPASRLKAAFAGLNTALGENRIAFGRRGFCIKLAHAVRKGPLQFALVFRRDGVVLSGRGVVRWIAPKEHAAGIEITHLDQPGLDWMIAQLEQSKPLAFIPSSPGLAHRLESKAA
jgi:CheY-like chemotaxis protein